MTLVIWACAGSFLREKVLLMLFPSSGQGSFLPTSTKQLEATWTPVSWKAVTINDPFWTLHIRVNREHTLPSIYRCPCRDRKSTRLNSSHSQISYAVFCLKKKNKQ